MFIESIVCVGGICLAVNGLAAMLQGKISGPAWWLILAMLIGAVLGAWFRDIPFGIRATDLSGATKEN